MTIKGLAAPRALRHLAAGCIVLLALLLAAPWDAAQAAGHGKGKGKGTNHHTTKPRKGKKGKKGKGKSHKKKHHATAPTVPTAPAAPAGVRAIPVSFAVTNTNTSFVPCATDNGNYTIAGTLFLPPSTTPNGVTLYAHGLGFGAWFWHFTAVPGYDYATYEAQQGHASVVIDRLGYGASSEMNGSGSCVGGQASVLHQVIQDLRSGNYTSTGSSPLSFSRVGLAGHSAAGELAQIEAYSFKDVDALAVVDWADQSYSPMALTSFAADGGGCFTNPETQINGQGSNYGTYGSTADTFNGLMFAGADPAVVSAVDAIRSNDPCGDILSILNAVPVDVANLGSITVPVVYVWGDQDANYIIGSPWWQLQEALFTGSSKVTDVTLVGSGHAVTLQRTAPQLMQAMDHWLSASGL
jgi:pimeloyl-ACP methyl ester carboxylesterase